MKGLIALILCGMVLITQAGCATWVAVRMPGPVQDEAVELGMRRSEVEGYLGVGPASQYEDRGTIIARYEYSDGPPAGSKARAIPYVAADLFSVFLSELIFWPIEEYAKAKIKRVGTAEYDDNVLVAWKISRRSGETLDQKVSAGPPPEAGGSPGEAGVPPEEASETPDEVRSETPVDEAESELSAGEEEAQIPEVELEPPSS